MWTIEAYRADGDTLVWDLDLAGMTRDLLEDHLGLETVDVPGSLPLTVDHIRSLLTEALRVDPTDYLAVPHRLEFFLAEYSEDV